MGTKVTVDDLNNLLIPSSVTKINDNFDKTANEFDKVVYRDGSQAITGNIDMNSHRVINLPYAITNHEPVTLEQVQVAIASVANKPGVPGVPGGNVMSVGAFEGMRLGATEIPAGTELVQTIGFYQGGGIFTRIFSGSAKYLYDSSIDASYLAAHPVTSFKALDGRGFRLNEPVWDMYMLGGKSGSENNTAPSRIANSTAAQTAADAGAPLHCSAEFFCNPNTPLLMFRNGVGTWRLTGDDSQTTGLSWDTNNTHTRPMMGIPEAYVDGFDDTLRSWATGNVLSANPSIPTRRLHVEGVNLRTYFGKWATVMNTCNLTSSVFRSISVSSAHRGLFNCQSFDHVYEHVHLFGFFYNAGRTLLEIERDYGRSFMLYVPGQAIIKEISGNGFGTGVLFMDNVTLEGGRLEVGECGYQFGGKAYIWDGWNGTTFTGGNRGWSGEATGLQTESCRRGADIPFSAVGTISGCGFTGFAGAVPNGQGGGKDPLYGLRIGSNVDSGLTIENTGGSDICPVINYGGPTFVNCSFKSPRGLNSLISRTDAGYNKPSRQTNVSFNPSVNETLPVNRRTASFNTNSLTVGLTNLDINNPNKFARNLSGVAFFPEGATSSTVLFQAQYTSNEAAFASGPFVTVVDTSNPANPSYPPGTYFIATTLVGPNGETGVNYNGYDDEFSLVDPAQGHFKKLVITGLDKRLDMTFPSVPGLRRRVYIGTTRGNWDKGMFEQDGTLTSMSLSYLSGPTAMDVPPEISSIIPSRYEDDTNYHVHASFPSWYTHLRSTPAGPGASDKRIDRFTIVAETPAPAGGGTVNWLITR